MRLASAAAGLDSSNARLIRMGENALFHLPSAGAVARVARSMGYWADAGREVAISHWLAAEGIRAARACAAIDQPVEAAGQPVTFWEFIDGRDGDREDVTDLAEVLRRVHQLPRPASFTLPAEDVLGRIPGRLQSAAVPAADREFLQARLDELEVQLPRLRFPLPPGPTHGDAHVQNLMITADGPVLIDLERFSWGQPEWDLAMTATEWQTAGWWTDEEYARFAGAYGWDVTTWDGYPVLRATHELKMTSWLAQLAGESPDAAREYKTRMWTLRGQAAPGDWQGF
jgi:aminoglycoside phosphotransferase (APT) family kinase protein